MSSDGNDSLNAYNLNLCVFLCRRVDVLQSYSPTMVATKRDISRAFSTIRYCIDCGNMTTMLSLPSFCVLKYFPHKVGEILEGQGVGTHESLDPSRGQDAGRHQSEYAGWGKCRAAGFAVVLVIHVADKNTTLRLPSCFMGRPKRTRLPKRTCGRLPVQHGMNTVVCRGVLERFPTTEGVRLGVCTLPANVRPGTTSA